MAGADPPPRWPWTPLWGPQAQEGPSVKFLCRLTLPHPPTALPAEAPWRLSLRLRGALSRRLASQFTEKAGDTRRAFPPAACAPAAPPALKPHRLCPCVLPLSCRRGRILCSCGPPLTGQGHDRVRGAISGPLLSPPAAFTSPGSVLPECKLVLTPLLRETFRPHFLLPAPHFYTHTHTHTHTHVHTHIDEFLKELLLLPASIFASSSPFRILPLIFTEAAFPLAHLCV